MKTIQIDVEFEDLDAGGVVHHPNYIKICERARNRWLAEYGIKFNDLKNKGIALVIASLNANYLRPIVHEPVQVKMTVTKVTEKSLTILHEIAPVSSQKRSPYFSAEITLVAAQIALAKSCPLPEEVGIFLDALQVKMTPTP